MRVLTQALLSNLTALALSLAIFVSFAFTARITCKDASLCFLLWQSPLPLLFLLLSPWIALLPFGRSSPLLSLFFCALPIVCYVS